MPENAAQRIEEAAAGIREELHAENETRDKNTKAIDARTTKIRTLALVAIAVGVIGIGVGIGGVVVGFQADDAAELAQAATDQLAADRRQGQVSSCHAYNEGLATSNNRVADELIGFLLLLAEDRSPEVPRTPEEQAEVDAIITAQTAEFETIRVPYRDCSAAGIEAFSEGTGGYLPPGVEP